MSSCWMGRRCIGCRLLWGFDQSHRAGHPLPELLEGPAVHEVAAVLAVQVCVVSCRNDIDGVGQQA